ncbi:MAG: hypothetical protein ACXWV6_02850 [Chitinophagaceae bacterium]
MKKLILLATVFIALDSYSQSVFGYWYGKANVKTKSSASNYLVELILQPEKGYVKGILSYYFKNTFRSIQVKGNYNTKNRELKLYNIPVTYYGSLSSMEVDCVMNLFATLRVAKAGSNLVGAFTGLPDNKYMCVDVNFNLALSADMSKQDSVLTALRNFKESNQVWKPSIFDTLPSVNIVQRKVINYVVESQFKERENVLIQEIEVDSDSLQVDFYDNGEIDGDTVSVVVNDNIIIANQRLSAAAISTTLYTTAALGDSLRLIMYAENLGTIPPNTGVLIIQDGNERHQIRFEGDFQKNSAIILRRK